MDYGKDDEWVQQYLPRSSPMRSLHGESAKKFLMSDFNEENVALAVAVAREIGIPGKTIAEAIMNFKGVPGRMDSCGQEISRRSSIMHIRRIRSRLPIAP